MQSIWVLENDESCRYVYQEILAGAYILRCFASLVEFRESLKNEKPPNLILADLRLPGQSFLSFLDSEDAKYVNEIPIIIVSAVDEIDVVHFCFEKGADDYLTKPFKVNELKVKVERLLETNLSDKPFEIDSGMMTVKRLDKESASLTSKEFQMFQVLSQSPNGEIERAALLERLWSQVTVGPRTLDVHLLHLRRKLELIGIEIKLIRPNKYRLDYFDVASSAGSRPGVDSRPRV